MGKFQAFFKEYLYLFIDYLIRVGSKIWFGAHLSENSGTAAGGMEDQYKHQSCRSLRNCGAE